MLGPGSSLLHPSGAWGEGHWDGEHVHQRIQGLRLPPPVLWRVLPLCIKHLATLLPRAPSPSSLPMAPESRRWVPTGATPSPLPRGRRRQHKEPWRCTVPRWVACPAQEVRTGPRLPPPLLPCKLFAKAFISAAKPPCARVVVAMPSRRTGPSVASRHAAHFLHRPLRKAPLYPHFGGFLFFPHPSPAAPSQAATRSQRH